MDANETARRFAVDHQRVKPRDSTRMRSRISGYVNRYDEFFTGARSENPQGDTVKKIPPVSAQRHTCREGRRKKEEREREKGRSPSLPWGCLGRWYTQPHLPVRTFFPRRSADSFNWTPNA